VHSFLPVTVTPENRVYDTGLRFPFRLSQKGARFPFGLSQHFPFRLSFAAPLGDGKTVDILVNLNEKRIGIEVETGKSDWKGNVRKCFESGLDKVFVVATRSSVYNKILNQLPKKKQNPKIQIIPASEVINKLKE